MTRILLADDSPHAQRMGEQILRLEDVDPDLVLVNVRMPHRSGYEICQYVKLSPRHKHVRVILTAGMKDQLDEAEAHRAQADGIVQKPFQASVLLDAVKPLAEMAAKERGSAPPPAAAPAKHPALRAPVVALIDPERVRAAVTVALDAALPAIIEEITEKVLVAIGAR